MAIKKFENINIKKDIKKEKVKLTKEEKKLLKEKKKLKKKELALFSLASFFPLITSFLPWLILLFLSLYPFLYLYFQIFLLP